MQGLQIRATSWHAKAYFWALGVWFAFKDYDYVPEKWKTEGNLCFYIRTLVIWMPLVFALHALFLGLALFTLVKMPITLFGTKVFIWSVVTSTVVVLLCWGVVRIYDALNRWEVEKLRSATRSPRPRRQAVIGPKVEQAVEAGMTFLEVVFEWIASQKKKVCPKITFVAPEASRKEA